MADNCFSGWAEAFPLGIAAAGGKGWNLARLDRYGFLVPPGGVLLTKGYRCFLAENGLADAVAAAVREGREPAGASGSPATDRLRELILSAPLPDAIMHEITEALTELKIADVPLAVRSSATVEDSSSASFAGIFESFLNVRGSINVAFAKKRCWASLWTEKAISYRRRMGLADVAPETAVVIMAMVEAEAAGVAFSCDPRSGREDVVYVTANLGLGESVVAGAAEPDEYAVAVGFHAPQMSLLSKKLGRKEKMTIAAGTGGTVDVASGGASDVQALPDDAVMTLARLVRRIYGALGHHEEHQDVEWVFDGSRFHVVQSRPVTVLPRHSYEGLHDEPDYWSNANLREVLPMVISPLGWTTMSDPLEKILTLPLRVSGYRPLPGVVRKRLFAGRGYFNISVMQWEYHAAFAVPPTRLNDIIGGHQPEIKVPALTPTMFIRCAGRTIRYLARTIGARRRADASCAAIIAHAAGILASSLAARSDRELTALVRQVGERMEAATDVHLVLSGGGATIMVLAPLLDYFFPGKGTSVANALLVGSEGITSAEHGLLLADLADLVESDPAARQFFSHQPLETDRWQEALPASSPFGKAFREFLGTYGHRGVYELDIRNARWREDPSWLLKVVQGNIGGGHAGILRKRQRETAETAWRQVRARIPRLLHPFLRGLVRRAGKEAAQREMAKSTLVHISGVLRAIAQEVGSRLMAKGLLPERDDIYFAGWEELEDILTGTWDGRGLDHLTSDRKARHAELEKMPAPDLIEAGVARHVRSPEVGTGDALVGIGVAAGVATGPVRIILHPDDGHRLRPGEVLVAPSTDPAWTPLFLRMAALITETGGYISHGAIVAREYGIPAVVNVPGVLKRLKEGEEVTVDGNTGRVILHRETKSEE